MIVTASTTRLASLGWRLLRVSDLLNERFVAMARLADEASRHGTQIMRRRLPNCQASPAISQSVDLAGQQEDAVVLVRARLSDLHLRVGQSIYHLEKERTDSEPVTRQLIALLDEIERLGSFLRRVDGDEDSSPLGAIAEVERFLDQTEEGSPEGAPDD